MRSRFPSGSTTLNSRMPARVWARLGETRPAWPIGLNTSGRAMSAPYGSRAGGVAGLGVDAEAVPVETADFGHPPGCLVDHAEKAQRLGHPLDAREFPLNGESFRVTDRSIGTAIAVMFSNHVPRGRRASP